MSAKPPKIPKLDRFFRFLYSLAAFLDEFKDRHPRWFKFAVFIPVSLILIYFARLTGIDDVENPAGWPFPAPFSLAAITKSGVSFILSIVLVEVLGRAFFPLLFYLPQTIAMRNVGLYYVTEDPYESWGVVQKAVDWHEGGEKIRVICISGRHLFREPAMPLPGGRARRSPLHEEALRGNLEVIMPRSIPDNQTIKNRYATYTEPYKRNNELMTINDFIAEIEAGKRFLRSHGNIVHEHDILCVWRIILCSELCVVQNYFPNPGGEDSFLAPIMAFRKADKKTAWIRYYDTFCELFKLVKEGCSRQGVLTEIIDPLADLKKQTS